MEPPVTTPDRAPRHLVRALALAQGALFATLGLARWGTFHNETFDLAFYTRIAWGLARGDFWEPMVDAHVYGLHLSPVLVPLGAIGAVFGTAPTLIVAQAAALAGATFPIARIGARHLGRAGAIAGAVAWLLYPNLAHVAGYEVHPGAMAALPLAWVAWALDAPSPTRAARGGLALGTLGALACREDLALVLVLAVALFGWRHRRDRPAAWTAAALGALSIAWALLFFFVLHPRYAPERGSLELHFGHLGGSPLDVALALVTRPGDVIAHLASPARLLYLPKILAPLALLTLFAPRWLVPALPVVAINLLSAWPTTTQLDVQYLTPALPFLVAGSLDGAGRLARRVPAAAILVGAALVGHALSGGTPLAADFDAAAFRPDADTAAAHAVVDAIGPDASVQAPYPLLAHLAERPRLHRTTSPEANADFYVLDAAVRRRFAGSEDLLRTLEEPPIRDWMARDDHGLRLAQGDYLLLQRGLPPREGLGGRVLMNDVPPIEGRRIAACLAVAGARLDGDLLALDLVAHGPCPTDLALRIGVEERAPRVDLPFAGWLSPHHLRAGDRVLSVHRLDAPLREAGPRLRVGALRQSGARPEHADPMSVRLFEP